MNANNQLPSFIAGKDILATQLLELSVMIVRNIREYAKENGIFLPENDALNRLFSEAKRTLDDLNSLENQKSPLTKLADEKKHPRGTDEDEPEPTKVTQKNPSFYLKIAYPLCSSPCQALRPKTRGAIEF